MTLKTAILSITCCALAGGVLGFLTGLFLGQITPDVATVLVPHLRAGDRAVRPDQVLLGLGLINGLMWGFFGGLVSVLAVTWYNVRALGKGDRQG